MTQTRKTPTPLGDRPLTLGAHMSIAGGLYQALLAARQRNCRCVQLFCSNQRQWRHPPLSAADVDAFRRMRQDSELHPVVVHGGYLINLAAGRRAGAILPGPSDARDTLFDGASAAKPACYVKNCEQLRKCES